METTQSQIKRLEGLLTSDFAKKAPPQVVEKERSKLDTYKQTARKIKDQLDALQ
jgi:valyl-tRNA synthetase